EEHRNRWENLEHLGERDEVKFVVKDRADYEWARSVIRDRGLDRRVEEGSLRALLMSPVWGDIDLEAFAGWILEDGLPVRFQLQLHKLVWGPERQGV
ncbi:MAG: 7-carboxy-7-deazaguanine synthase QueE, partial [Gemmatimonadota bacterium]